MKTVYLCRICKKPTGKSPGSRYCYQCAKDWNKYKATRYHVGDVWIWIRNNRIVKAIQAGVPILPINDGQEMIE